MGGPKSSQSRSHTSGTSASLTTLHLRLPFHGVPFLISRRYVAPVVVRPRHLDRRPILKRRRLLTRLNLRQQVLESVVRNLTRWRGLNGETRTLFLEVNGSSGRQPEFICQVFRQAHRQTIPPLRDFDLHRLAPSDIQCIS